MRLTYHVLIVPEALHKIAQWQIACQQWGFDVRFDSDLSTLHFSRENSILRLNYRQLNVDISVYTSTTSDVKDICDELGLHITEDQTLAVNVDVDAEQEEVYSVTIALLVLTKLLDGTLYIEGDGTFVTTEQALENARAIVNNMNN